MDPTTVGLTKADNSQGPLSRALTSRVLHFIRTLSDYTVYANFNSFVATGRILDSKVVKTKAGNDMLAVTMITTPVKNDERGLNVTFVNQGGLVALFTAGQLPAGREITVTGHIEAVSETYEDKDGSLVIRKRPQIELGYSAQILDGGLGRMPATEEQKTARAAGTKVVRKPAVDKTPATRDY